VIIIKGKLNWYKFSQQLELFEYGSDVWPLSPNDEWKKQMREKREQEKREEEQLSKLRKERGSYYEPEYFKQITSTLRNSALRFTIQEFQKQPVSHEIIGSWFSKNSRGKKPKDFDILITVDDVSDIIGEKISSSLLEFSGISIDVFYTDGRRSVVPVQITPQTVEYQVKKIKGV